MSDEKLLAATHTAALAVATIGAVAPFSSNIYLPSPRRYVAIWTVWFVLGLVAKMGARAGQIAGRFSLLLLLTMLVAGPFGTKAVNFLNLVAKLFPAQEVASS